MFAVPERGIGRGWFRNVKDVKGLSGQNMAEGFHLCSSKQSHYKIDWKEPKCLMPLLSEKRGQTVTEQVQEI